MASIALMVGGVLLNATAFVGGNYLVKYLSGDDGKAAEAEREQHDKAQEAYAEAQAKYKREWDAYFDWIAIQDRLKKQADQDLTDTDYALKLYAKTHNKAPQRTMPKEPKFSDFYTPSEAQKEGELAFVGLSAFGLGFAALHYL